MIIHTAIPLVKSWHDFDLSDLASFQQCPDTVQKCWLGTIPKKEFECGGPVLEGKSLAVRPQDMQPLNSALNEWTMICLFTDIDAVFNYCD